MGIMNTRWWHIIALVLLGYAIGYYWTAPAKLTLAKIYPATGS